MKKFSKVLSVCIVLCLLAGIIVACGGKETKDDTTKNEGGVKTYKLVQAMCTTPLATKAKYYDEVGKLINDKLEKDLGFRVDFVVNCIPAEQYSDKLAMDIAAGKQYDLVRMNNLTYLKDWQSKSMAKDIDSYLTEKGKDLLSYLSAEAWKEVTINGKKFAIPMPAFPVTATMWTRGDILEKYGISVPKTLAEWDKYLEMLKADSQFEIPMVNRLENLEFKFLGCFTETPGSFMKDGKIYPKYYDPGYKEFITKMNEWYQKGYMDETIVSYTEEQGIDVFKNGKAAINGGNLWQLEWGTLNAVEKAHPEYKITPMPILTDAKKTYSSSIATEFLMIPATSKYPDKIMQYVNWAMTNEENYMMVVHGVQDKTYKMEGQTIVPAESGVASDRELLGDFFIGYNFNINMKFTSSKTPAASQQAYLESANYDKSKLYVPITNYTAVKLSSEINMKKDEAENAINAYIQDMIKGRAPLSNWDAMLKEFENMGGMEAYNVYTEAYNSK